MPTSTYNVIYATTATTYTPCTQFISANTAFTYQVWQTQTTTDNSATVWHVRVPVRSPVQWWEGLPPPQLTEEETALYELAQREERERRAQANRAWEAKKRRARRKALTLLLHHLTPAQRQEYRTARRFTVVGGTTGTRYRIRQGRIGNIDVCREGYVVHRLCCHPGADCPDEDVMLAQALHLSVNEDEFVRTANVHRLPQHALQEYNLAA